jgi:alpha-N-arabinofuranosidase
MRLHDLLLLAVSAPSLAIEMVVRSTGGNATTPHMYGFLHEDINNSGDGGIYAELIRNRAFQGSEKYPSNLDGWSPVHDAVLSLKRLSTPLSAALPYSVNVAPREGKKKGKMGLSNAGFWGMDVKVQKYTGSFWVRGTYKGDFQASLKSAITGEVFGTAKISGSSTSEWTEKQFELVPTKNAPNSNNTFVLEFDAGVRVPLALTMRGTRLTHFLGVEGGLSGPESD